MSELLKRKIGESKGKEVIVFTLNNFRYSGKLTNSDEKFLEVLDRKTGNFKLIVLEEIKELEVLG